MKNESSEHTAEAVEAPVSLRNIEVEPQSRTDRALTTIRPDLGRPQVPDVAAPQGEPDAMIGIFNRPGGRLFVLWISERWRILLTWSLVGLTVAVLAPRWREIVAALQALMQSVSNAFGTW